MIHSISNSSPSININFQQGACSDQYVGTMTYNGQNFEVQGSKIFNLTRKSALKGQHRQDINYSNGTLQTNNKKFVVLLESPHIDEYLPVGQSYKTAPAWGSTGDRFNSCFIKVLNDNLKVISNKFSFSGNQDFDVYLVNAIQYQCSLGLSPLEPQLRDYVFQRLWNQQPNSFLQDLADRLNIINPDIIVNACTINLQRKCCNSILPLLTNQRVSFYSSNQHMSVWCKNTQLR